MSNFTCNSNTIIYCFSLPKHRFGIKTKWDILDQNIVKYFLEMDKSWKNFHLWWKPEIRFHLYFTREEKASGNISKKLQRKWNSCFRMQLLLRYEYLATKRETAVRITSINKYRFKNRGMSIHRLYFAVPLQQLYCAQMHFHFTLEKSLLKIAGKWSQKSEEREVTNSHGLHHLL